MKTQCMEFFIPDEYITQLIRCALRILLSIVAVTCILYALSWACGGLVLFVQSFTRVCHVLYAAVGSSPYIEIAVFVFLMLLNVKFAHMLYSSIFKEVKHER